MHYRKSYKVPISSVRILYSLGKLEHIKHKLLNLHPIWFGRLHSTEREGGGGGGLGGERGRERGGREGGRGRGREGGRGRERGREGGREGRER